MTRDIFWAATKLDPLDCYPNASYPPMWDNVELSLRKSKSRNAKYFPRCLRFLAFITTAVKSSLSFFHVPLECHADHVFYGLTHNQRTSLQPVLDVMNDRDSGSSALFSSGDIKPLINKASVWAIPFFLPLVIRAFRETDYRKKSFRWALDDYWRAYGLYIVFRRWFRKNRPQSVIVSNDHSLVPCVINKAAQDEGIPTFYIQHACVTEKFPPLRMDFALLEGLDAKEKYSAVSDGKTETHLIGIPKFDAFSKRINTSTKCKSVGICFSLADDLDRSLELLNGMSEVDDIRFIVRPHMGMSSEAKQTFAAACTKFNFDYSTHESEQSFDFLDRIDVLISGTSAIALEAVMLNVTSLNYVLNLDISDWYGFIENGLTQSTDNIDKLKMTIEDLKTNRPEVRGLAERYCATISTAYAGRSSELAAEKIISLSQTQKRSAQE